MATKRNISRAARQQLIVGLFAVALLGVVILITLTQRTVVSSAPERQGGVQSLRDELSTIVVEDTTLPSSSVPSLEVESAEVPAQIRVDPQTFLPTFADSVVVADMDTICNTPAPDNGIYIAIDGNDANTGTIDQPLATISKGIRLAQAGQTVLVREGNYEQSALFSGKLGEPDAYITLRSYPGEVVTLVPGIGNDAVSFRNGNAYINVACLEMQGPALLPESVPRSPEYFRDRTLAGDDISEFPSNYGHGVSIGDRADTRAGNPTNHHIRIVANDIRDFTAAGIAALESNHISAIGNRTYRNAKYSCYSASGIAFGYMLDAGGPDNRDGYSNYVVGNVSYENENRSLQCFTDNLGPVLTDGNGIIIDENDTQGGAYTARTLVADNITFGNGGRGILVFDSSRVDVINNVSYRNAFTVQLMGRDAPNPEIAVDRSEDVRVYNNIAIPSEGNEPFSDKGSDVEAESNEFRGPGDGSDLFEEPAIDGSGNFTLKDSATELSEAGKPFLASPGAGDIPVLVSPVPVGPIFNDG